MHNNIISFSGGKDSTAMLLMMLERGEAVDDIVFFDGGWEFPAMYDHLEQVEKFTKRTITRVCLEKPFDYHFSEKPIKSRVDGEVYKLGNGWPHMTRRWCTRLKINAINKYIKDNYINITMNIGYAADEVKRAEKQKSDNFRYPLIEWNVCEVQALQYCRERGFNWGGLYDIFKRVSCWCCPLGGLKTARLLRKHFPDLWKKAQEMETWLDGNETGKRYINLMSISDLERRFSEEDIHNARMLPLPGLNTCNHLATGVV